MERDTTDGKAQYTIDVNHLNILTDSMILCHLAEAVFGPIKMNQNVVEILNVVTGMELTLDDAEQTAERIWNVIRAFSAREGSRRDDDSLPKRFMTEPIPDGPSKGMLISEETLEKMKDEYYTIRGWDRATGIPTRERLLELDLPDISEDMRVILENEKGGSHE